MLPTLAYAQPLALKFAAVNASVAAFVPVTPNRPALAPEVVIVDWLSKIVLASPETVRVSETPSVAAAVPFNRQILRICPLPPFADSAGVVLPVTVITIDGRASATTVTVDCAVASPGLTRSSRFWSCQTVTV